MLGMSTTSRLFTALCCIVATNCDVIVNTKYGRIRGLTTERSQVFLGIPYAAPPIGQLRWRSPQAPQSWSPDVYNATEVQPACPQKMCAKYIPSRSCPNKTDESCLFLYIYAPLHTTPSSKLPVMVYIHGGNFILMGAGSPSYDGQNFVARGNVILVTMDYRMGALGFLYTGSGGDAARGNYGLQDQRYALQWVRDNIPAFGGDPSKVTLFGQSAGAQSTYNHLTSGKADGLFRNVIIESDPAALPYKTKEQATELSDKFAKKLGCVEGDMDCLRSKTTDEVVDTQDFLMKPTELLFLRDNFLSLFQPFCPVVDGDEVPMQPMEAAKLQKIPDIPVVIGTVSEETRIFVYDAVTFALSKVEYETALPVMFPSSWRQVRDVYPAADEEDSRTRLAELLTDLIFTCATRNISTSLAYRGQAPVWRFVFDHASSFHGWENFTFCEGHVCHSEEVPYVFDTAEQYFDSDEKVLSHMMGGYWTNMAYTSSPNEGPSTVAVWPTLPTSNHQVGMLFKTPNDTLVLDYRKQFCDFWDSVGYTP